MKVIAAPGLLVPKDGQARRYISSDQHEDVPDTAYYRRRIEAGELIVLPDDVAPPSKKEK